MKVNYTAEGLDKPLYRKQGWMEWAKSNFSSCVIYGSLIFLLAVTWFQKSAPVRILTRDPISIAKGAFYWGAISNIGVLLWCAAAAFCFFSFLLVQQLKPGVRSNWALLALGLITSMLLVDDLFMIHEQVFPGYLGLSENVLYGFYAVAVTSVMFFFRKVLFTGSSVYFIVAIAFFVPSLMFDTALELLLPGVVVSDDLLFFVEDGLKLLGIGSWCLYSLKLCTEQVQKVFVQQSVANDSV